ncbi:hypothetical protein JCM11641_004613 [Rhodosporidiobolus odoratus]
MFAASRKRPRSRSPPAPARPSPSYPTTLIELGQTGWQLPLTPGVGIQATLDAFFKHNELEYDSYVAKELRATIEREGWLDDGLDGEENRVESLASGRKRACGYWAASSDPVDGDDCSSDSSLDEPDDAFTFPVAEPTERPSHFDDEAEEGMLCDD